MILIHAVMRDMTNQSVYEATIVKYSAHHVSKMIRHQKIFGHCKSCFHSLEVLEMIKILLGSEKELTDGLVVAVQGHA